MKSRLQFETVNKLILMLTTAIPDCNYGTWYAVRSAFLVTAELLVLFCVVNQSCISSIVTSFPSALYVAFSMF